jgi:hypothetical protein
VKGTAYVEVDVIYLFWHMDLAYLMIFEVLALLGSYVAYVGCCLMGSYVAYVGSCLMGSYVAYVGSCLLGSYVAYVGSCLMGSYVAYVGSCRTDVSMQLNGSIFKGGTIFNFLTLEDETVPKRR